MDKIIEGLERDLKYAQQRLEETKDDVVRTIERLSTQNLAVELYENMIQEYKRAISILKDIS